jgi:hypothetical protein
MWRYRILCLPSIIQTLVDTRRLAVKVAPVGLEPQPHTPLSSRALNAWTLFVRLDQLDTIRYDTVDAVRDVVLVELLRRYAPVKTTVTDERAGVSVERASIDASPSTQSHASFKTLLHSNSNDASHRSPLYDILDISPTLNAISFSLKSRFSVGDTDRLSVLIIESMVLNPKTYQPQDRSVCVYIRRAHGVCSDMYNWTNIEALLQMLDDYRCTPMVLDKRLNESPMPNWIAAVRSRAYNYVAPTHSCSTITCRSRGNSHV